MTQLGAKTQTGVTHEG